MKNPKNCQNGWIFTSSKNLGTALDLYYFNHSEISKNVKRSANSDRSANHLIYLNSGDDFLEICKIVWKSKGDNLPSTDKITGVGRAVPEPSMNNQ